MRVLVRVVGLLAASEAAFWLVSALSGESVGVNIGAGLAAFGAVLLTGFAWALVDGLGRGARTSVVIRRWAVAGVLYAVASVLLVAVRDRGLDLQVVLSDLSSLAPFLTGLVLVPAAIGAWIGSNLRRPGLA